MDEIISVARAANIHEFVSSLPQVSVYFYDLSRNVRKHTFWHVRPAKTQISLRILGYTKCAP